jgi:TonB family protein
MEIFRKSLSLVLLPLMLSISDAAQTAMSDLRASDSKALCTTEQPLYADRHGKPIWLDTDSLLKRATHCKAPEMPALARQARIDGYVFVDILVNDKGTVCCALLVSGHPLLATSAIDAAKNWTFRPKERDGKGVWFYGHLRFHFLLKRQKRARILARLHTGDNLGRLTSGNRIYRHLFASMSRLTSFSFQHKVKRNNNRKRN